MRRSTMEDSPLVSVIIPTYKRPQECLRAVRSVLFQTLQDFEIIVGDDYGKDETQRLLEALKDPRIRYFDNQGEGGSASENRNLCISRSRAPYLTFLDSDDLILPNKLELQVRALEGAGPEVGFVIAGTRVVKVYQGNYFEYKDLIPTAEGDIKEAYFERKLSCYNTSLMVRRDVMDVVGAWDSGTGPYDDSEFILRLLLQYRAARVKEIVTLWFDHDGESFSNDQDARRNGLEFFMTKHARLIPEYPEWAGFRIRELSKVLFFAGEGSRCRQWLGQLPQAASSSLSLMKWISFIPGYCVALRAYHSLYSKYNQPDWLKAKSMPLEALIPKEHKSTITPIL